MLSSRADRQTCASVQSGKNTFSGQQAGKKYREQDHHDKLVIISLFAVKKVNQEHGQGQDLNGRDQPETAPGPSLFVPDPDVSISL